MSCRRTILSRPAMNDTGEKISPWRTPLSMLNGSDIAIFPLGCLTRTTPVAAVKIACIAEGLSGAVASGWVKCDI